MAENEREMKIKSAAAAIANARAGRRGAPPIVNVLDILPERLRDEVMEDAEAALEASGSIERSPRG